MTRQVITTTNYEIKPGDWILTEARERLYFVQQTSAHWGIFSLSNHHLDVTRFKLPLSGLKKTGAPSHDNPRF